MVGFTDQVEVALDVWEDGITEKHMRGDILRSYAYYANVDKINENTNLGHRISLVGNKYLLEKYMQMKYLTLHGVRWEISTVELQTPRVIVTLGGKYNGPRP